MLSSTSTTAIAFLGLWAGQVLAVPAPAPDRPAPPGPPTKVGDGAPVQKYLYRQATEPQNCGKADNCAGGVSQSYTLSVGATFGSGGGPNNWVSGGFSVSESWSKAETHTCTAKEGDRVCLWAVAAFTEYDVHSCGVLDCGTKRIKSPNEDNKGGGFVCGTNDQCKDLNTEFWKDGPKGGPQSNKDSTNEDNLNGH